MSKQRRMRGVICADKMTMLYFGQFLIHDAGFGWHRNPVTKMSAGIFIGGGNEYAIDWEEAYGGVFVIPNDLGQLFAEFCSGAPVLQQRMQ